MEMVSSSSSSQLSGTACDAVARKSSYGSPGAPVSAPCTWQEVERGLVGPRTFTLRTMAGRTREVGDLWSAMQGQGRSLHAAMAKLEGLLSEADWKEALAASTRRPVSRKPSRKG